MAEEKKHKIQVSVASRDIPGGTTDQNGNTEAFKGYGCAGIYFPVGDSEHFVTDSQLQELREAKAPKDFQGRVQRHPFTFIEVPESPSHKEGRK